MSELKVNKISPATGTAFTLGDSGDTFTVPSGATIVNSGTATVFGTAGADTDLSNLSATGEKLACQAWAVIGTSGNSILDSGGITGFSSVADNGTGDYAISFSSTMANITYSVVGSNIGSDPTSQYSCAVCGTDARNTTSVIAFDVRNMDGGVRDMDNVSIIVFGD